MRQNPKAPKLIQPHLPRAYTRRMSQEPATAHKYAALSLDQMIGLFLAQLYGWLIRCHETGAPFPPADMSQNVTKADALVHAFIRSRAAAQLERAGYTDAARAMRDIGFCSRNASHRIELAQGCHTELSSAAQGCEPQTPAELISRLETIIQQFEQADAIGSVLARMIVYTLACLTPETREAPKYPSVKAERIGENRRVGLGPPKMISAVRQGPPYPWPPPPLVRRWRKLPYFCHPGRRPGTQNTMAFPLAGSQISSAVFCIYARLWGSRLAHPGCACTFVCGVDSTSKAKAQVRQQRWQ